MPQKIIQHSLGFSRESRMDSIMRSSKQIMFTTKTKNKHVSNLLEFERKRIRNNENLVLIHTNKDINTERDSLSKMIALQKIYQRHSFDKYDPVLHPQKRNRYCHLDARDLMKMWFKGKTVSHEKAESDTTSQSESRPVSSIFRRMRMHSGRSRKTSSVVGEGNTWGNLLTETIHEEPKGDLDSLVDYEMCESPVINRLDIERPLNIQSKLSDINNNTSHNVKTVQSRQPKEIISNSSNSVMLKQDPFDKTPVSPKSPSTRIQSETTQDSKRDIGSGNSKVENEENRSVLKSDIPKTESQNVNFCDENDVVQENKIEVFKHEEVQRETTEVDTDENITNNGAKSLKNKSTNTGKELANNNCLKITNEKNEMKTILGKEIVNSSVKTEKEIKLRKVKYSDEKPNKQGVKSVKLFDASKRPLSRGSNEREMSLKILQRGRSSVSQNQTLPKSNTSISLKREKSSLSQKDKTPIFEGQKSSKEKPSDDHNTNNREKMGMKSKDNSVTTHRDKSAMTQREKSEISQSKTSAVIQREKSASTQLQSSNRTRREHSGLVQSENKNSCNTHREKSSVSLNSSNREKSLNSNATTNDQSKGNNTNTTPSKSNSSQHHFGRESMTAPANQFNSNSKIVPPGTAPNINRQRTDITDTWAYTSRDQDSTRRSSSASSLRFDNQLVNNAATNQTVNWKGLIHKLKGGNINKTIVDDRVVEAKSTRRLKRREKTFVLSRERTIFPGECKTTWQMRKFIDREVSDLMFSLSPKGKRQSQIDLLKEREQFRMPLFMDISKPTSAIFKDFKKYRQMGRTMTAP